MEPAIRTSSGRLLRAGADPNARNSRGNTALHVVIDKQAVPQILRMLLAAGADPHLGNETGLNALELARYLERVKPILAIEKHLQTQTRTPDEQARSKARP